MGKYTTDPREVFEDFKQGVKGQWLCHDWSTKAFLGCHEIVAYEDRIFWVIAHPGGVMSVDCNKEKILAIVPYNVLLKKPKEGPKYPEPTAEEMIRAMVAKIDTKRYWKPIELCKATGYDSGSRNLCTRLLTRKKVVGIVKNAKGKGYYIADKKRAIKLANTN
jgi:hypothetical protein